MIKLINGDCLEEMRKMEEGSIDFMLIDPPYGIDLTPQRSTGKFKNTKVLNDDNLNWLDRFVELSYKVMKNAGCVFCGWQTVDIFKQAFEKKFKIKNILVWNKDWFGMGNNYRPNYELIILICKDNIKTKSKNKSNILTYRRIAPQKLLHSCEKPLPLLKDLLLELTEENDIVLDCFAGSGSTGVAAVNTNRKFIGIELDKNYFEIAKKRIEEAKNEVN